eukprot:1560399-Rhodomonas_salina.1
MSTAALLADIKQTKWPKRWAGSEPLQADASASAKSLPTSRSGTNDKGRKQNRGMLVQTRLSSLPCGLQFWFAGDTAKCISFKGTAKDSGKGRLAAAAAVRGVQGIHDLPRPTTPLTLAHPHQNSDMLLSRCGWSL